MDDGSRAQLYRRVAAADGASSELQPIHSRLFLKPTLLCCGGRGINQLGDRKETAKVNEANTLRATSGFSKIGHALLGMPDKLDGTEPLDIVTIRYPFDDATLEDDIREYAKAKLNNRKPMILPYVEAFAKKHLYPLIEIDGTALPPEQARRNLRNVHILGHSYGSVFADQLNLLLNRRLAALGLDKDTCSDLCAQVCFVSAGMPLALGDRSSAFTSLHVVNRDDEVANESAPITVPVYQMLQRKGMLLDKKAENVPFGVLPDPKKHYSPKSLLLLPVQASVFGNSLKLDHVSGSRQMLMYATQHVQINGLGEIVHKTRAISPYLKRSDVSGKFDDSFTPIEDTAHQAATYFYFGRHAKPKENGGQYARHGSLLRLGCSSVLMNAMNNAVSNRQEGEFTPLAITETLLKYPAQLNYRPDGHVPEAHIARSEHYKHRMEAALSCDMTSQDVPRVV